ncbi:MAG: hypothetical protein JSW07_12690 [bacterium]|nr:MAG: hypothetical protein JSW07_12690 [bacterium]
MDKIKTVLYNILAGILTAIILSLFAWLWAEFSGIREKLNKIKEFENKLQSFEDRFGSKLKSLEGRIEFLEQNEGTKPDPCLLARIVSPKGTKYRQDAANFPVENNVEIKWEPSDCIMTVEYYQKNMLQKKLRGIKSGEIINIGRANSGETEIKIWREGSSEPTDTIWVWVK